MFALDPTKRFSALVFDVDGLMTDSERVERVSHSTTRSILTSLWANRSENAGAFDEIFERVMDRLARSHVNHLRFKVIVGGDQVRAVKPAPDVYLLAAKKLRMDPGSCLVLEDSDNGIRAAHSAGAIPLLIPDFSLRSHDAIPADVIKAAYDQFDSLGRWTSFLARCFRHSGTTQSSAASRAPTPARCARAAAGCHPGRVRSLKSLDGHGRRGWEPRPCSQRQVQLPGGKVQPCCSPNRVTVRLRVAFPGETGYAA